MNHLIRNAPISYTTESMKEIISKRRLMPIGSASRQLDMSLSWVGVALQQGYYTHETVKGLAKEDFGAVSIVLPKKLLKQLAAPENLDLLRLAVRATAEAAGVQEDFISVIKQVGFMFGRDRIVVKCPTHDIAKQLKEYVSPPSLQ